VNGTPQAEACATKPAAPLQLNLQFENWNPGGFMTTTSATPSWHSTGLYLQIAGAGAFLAGIVLSLHHYAIGVCFLAGAAAFYAGKKLKAS
jgi:hypothetical protein